VLLLTIDTWRADSAGPSLMPRLHEFASRGVLFERLYAAGSNTRLAVPSMHRSSPQARSVAEIVADHGVATSATIAVALDPGAYGFPNDENFGQQAVATDITDRALERIAEYRGKRHLAWVHYYDPHLPYSVHEGVAVAAEPASLPAAYRSELSYLDFHLGRLFDQLEKDGMLERTAVIIAGDHGEGFGKRGIVGHGRTGYDEMFRVPGALVAPGLRSGSYPHLVSHKDIPATILGAFGLAEAAVHAEFLGRSWLRLRAELDKPLHDFVVARSSRYVSGLAPVVGLAALVTNDGWKLVASLEDRLFELYNLKADPGEASDLAHDTPEIVGALWRKLALFCDDVGFPEERLRL
jgi:arylsulfatase A-like enzyme